jgi:hypothetical protein
LSPVTIEVLLNRFNGRTHARTHRVTALRYSQGVSACPGFLYCVKYRTCEESYCVSLFIGGLIKDYVAKKDQIVIENE